MAAAGVGVACVGAGTAGVGAGTAGVGVGASRYSTDLTSFIWTVRVPPSTVRVMRSGEVAVTVPENDVPSRNWMAAIGLPDAAVSFFAHEKTNALEPTRTEIYTDLCISPFLRISPFLQGYIGICDRFRPLVCADGIKLRAGAGRSKPIREYPFHQAGNPVGIELLVADFVLSVFLCCVVAPIRPGAVKVGKSVLTGHCPRAEDAPSLIFHLRIRRQRHYGPADVPRRFRREEIGVGIGPGLPL